MLLEALYTGKLFKILELSVGLLFSSSNVAMAFELFKEKIDSGHLELSPLMEAIVKNDLAGVDSLVKQGASVNERDKVCRSTLHYASENIEK